MAEPRSTRKKKTPAAKKPRLPKKPPMAFHLKRGVAGLIVLIALVLILGIVVNQALKKNQRPKRPVPVAVIPPVPRHPVYPPAAPPPPVTPPVTPPAAPPLAALPPFEIYPPAEPPVAAPVHPPARPPRPGKLPRIAIIIDDIGYDAQIAEKFIGLNAAITLSILPHSPHQREIIRMAREKGLDTMLHLPMEPLEYPAINPGPGALLSAMSPDALIRQLNEDIDAVPYIKGVNNHMGSRMTGSSDQMNQILSSIRKRDLFFIDSRTTTDTQARSSARLFQVPYAERDVFLDNVQEPEAIRRQFRLLLQKAAANGQALAIGHPHGMTLQILKEELPEIQKKVTIVPASSVVRPVG
jgi:polysaccharide deacetylase 2 family uncharacterized protein YibQ